MKKIAITLLFVLSFTLSFSQESELNSFEKDICKCISEKFDSIGINFRLELQKFEDYLIENRYIKNRDGKNFYNVFYEAKKTGVFPIKVDYEIEGMTLETYNLYAKCFYSQIHELELSESNLKLKALYDSLRTTVINEEVTIRNLSRIIINTLDSKDFEKELYHFHALQTIYYNSRLEFKKEEISQLFLANIEVSKENEIFLNGELISVNNISGRIKNIKKTNVKLHKEKSAVRIIVHPEVRMGIITDIKKELRNIEGIRINYSVRKEE